MKLKDHKLADAPFRQAHAFGGEMIPTLIVLHDTAGRLNPGSSVDWFCSEECPNSAHVVVERDGTITQCVPFNRKAWHAGPSSWQGKPYCNSYAIGIEIVNPGLLDKDGRAWFHKKTERGFGSASVKKMISKPHGGEGWWMDYTAEQIAAVTNLCKTLVGAYTIQDISTHWAIAPGRKVDTNPLFPVEQVRRAALRVRSEPALAGATAGSASAAISSEAADAPLAPITPLGQEAKPAKWLSSAKFEQLNDMVEQGSKTGGYLKSLKNWMHTVFWSSSATAGGVYALADPNKPAVVASHSWAALHPLLFGALCALLAALLVGGLAWLYAKRIEKALVAAWQKGLHQPSGTAP